MPRKIRQSTPNKELYHQLRSFSWPQIWTVEVPAFDKASAAERTQRVALIRAAGVVFTESGDPACKEALTKWLLSLLHDPAEIIRRYAMAALPKIGPDPAVEAELLSLWRACAIDREKKFLAQALEKIGGSATLSTIATSVQGFLPQTEQKIKAGIARGQNPSAIRMDPVLSQFENLRIHLRGRRGLEPMVRDEVEKSVKIHDKFRVDHVGGGLVVLVPLAPFSLADLYALRCFGTVGFVPGEAESIESLAAVVTAPLARRVLATFTEGAIRYRLNFVGKGHQRAAVRLFANQIYALCPEILNDARNVTWTMDIYPGKRGPSVELRPNLTPDPRFAYRRRDVPAASHPQLAACMARLAGRMENEIVWDPFCGSGLELIESALLGGVRAIHGTDLSEEAITIAQANFAAAPIQPIPAHFICSDFRTYAASRRLGPDSVTLIISNPPLGMRVPVPDLRGMIDDLFKIAGTVLRPGGRLVFANPISMSKVPGGFQLLSRQSVDFGGFDCRVEKYLKLANAPRR
jgi:predicted RNA methylase